MSATVFDATRTELGEGPVWAEGRLFWFDILGERLYAQAPGDGVQSWRFEEYHSAAAAVEGGGLIIASETGLWRFDPATGARELVVPVEADDPGTRSNDGRADRQGGFWIGTMSKNAAHGAGAIWRYFKGELRKVRAGVTIPNAICFSPDGRRGYFADSREHRIYTWPLDAGGWPEGEPEVFFDLAGEVPTPDGAVVDSQGALWCALWGGARVVRIGTDGQILDEIALPATRVTCPAFGGDLRDLYVTSAQEGMDAAARAAEPLAGATFRARIDVPGLPEPMVILG